jgi:thiol:disulfide interchange protein DsbC
MTSIHKFLAGSAAATLALFAACAHADEAAIRKNLAERLPSLPAIEEIVKTPVPGLYEIRVGTDLFYSDAEGRYFVQGTIIDTKTQRNLTEEKQRKLLAISFDRLPLKDSFTVVRGNGKRKLAIFEDPNCGYCKRLEADLMKVDNATIHVFLYPILGQDSVEKARDLWCSRDKGRAWQDWMLKGQLAGRAPAQCDTTALERNVEFGRKFKINGTPTTIFADGSRTPGAMPADQIEKLIAGARDTAQVQ